MRMKETVRRSAVPDPEEQKQAASKVVAVLQEMRPRNDFYGWVADRMAPAEIVPCASVVGIGDQLRQYLKRNRPERRQCFKNAYYCAEKIPGVNVVYGYTTMKMSGLLIEHAWNEYNGQHFDVTIETPGVDLHGHVEVLRLTTGQCCVYMQYWMAHGFLVIPYYMQNVERKVMGAAAMPETSRQGAAANKELS